jgi:hypothetical protein
MSTSLPSQASFDPNVIKVCEALNDIGIPTRYVEETSGFLAHIRIVNGTLHVSPHCDASDVLHEGGHLAIVPGRYRGLANNNLDALVRHMLEDLDNHEEFDPDSPLYRAVIQCSDAEATAWAYAFGKYLRLADEDIIKDDQYPDEDGIPGGAAVRMCLAMRAFEGIHGLAYAGFCSVNRFGKLPVYPQLAFWTQEL